ncbi:MAG: response regulator [Clostridia bacterium]|jgi:PAS domain S-box-containing protein
MSGTVGKTILLVEDEVIIAMAEKAILEKHGYTVLTAGTGEQAVAMALTSKDVDLILMDINLGSGIDGTEAAALILDKQDIPLAFLSSHTERDVVEKTEGITSYGYIVKNSGETVLLASLKMAFRLYEAHRSIQTQRMDIEAAYEEMQVANEELLQTQHELIEREMALKAEKDLSDAVLEGIPGYLYVYDEEGRLVKWNKKHETMTGYSAEELSTMRLSDWFGEGDLRCVNEAVKQVFETGYGEVEADVLIKGGGTLRIRSNGVRLNMDGKNYFTGVGLDVTERRKTERRIDEQLDELRRWHSATLGREGRVLQLKAEINQLLLELGRPPRYTSATDQKGIDKKNTEADHE